MKKRTTRFGWTKQFQRVEQTIKASTRHLNILNPAHAEMIERSGKQISNLNKLHRNRVEILRGVSK